jgi:tight adherence protein B
LSAVAGRPDEEQLLMRDPTVLSMIIGIAVIVVVAGVSLVMVKSPGELAEARLSDLSGLRRSRAGKPLDAAAGILARPAAIDLGGTSFWTRLVPKAEDLNLLYEQADVNVNFKTFLGLVGALAVVGILFGIVFRLPIYLIPLGAPVFGMLPFLWLFHRRRKRIAQFIEAMPEAVELISRSLRAGHGLASGLHLVAEEMKGPVADEFNRVFEEQNLGIPIELSLRNMADRIPVMDVRFFVIAVVVQRATGGDLAEVLDKIGRLIRQRYEMHGHVKALTAEGRLSGIVLLGMPPAMLAYLCFANYSYVSVLFNTPMGVKMLAYATVGQFIGALMIKKIVAIKV